MEEFSLLIGAAIGLFGSTTANVLKGKETAKQNKRDRKGAAIKGYSAIRVADAKTERVAVIKISRCANTILRLFRPLLTLVCIGCAVGCEAKGLTNAAATFTTLSSTAVTWWFSDRSFANRAQK